MIFTETENLLLNISAGLTPECLSEHEIDLLEKVYGEDWDEIQKILWNVNES